MSKSLRRVTLALQAAGNDAPPVEADDATTAQMTADLLGCEVAQIAKSIIFCGQASGAALLFVTSGANRVDVPRPGTVAGEPLGKADAALIRTQTGFAIGGVAPIGHLTPPRAFFDPFLLRFDRIWAAAGTPRHLFGIAPETLLRISGARLAEFIA